MGARDFRITRLLWLATLAECVVLAFGGVGLLFMPDLVAPMWPWPLTPFTARALGAVYLAAFVTTLCLAIRPWWSPARIVVPMVALFTVLVTVLSLVGLGRLTNATSTAAWFVVYVAAAAIAVWHWWLYRGLPPAPDAIAPDRRVQTILLTQIVILGGYGLALLTLGSAVTGFWPWPIDDFHARMYSTAFLTPALGAFLLIRSGTHIEARTLGATQVVSGAFAVLGLLLVDANLHRVNWSAPGTWLWIGLCAAIALVGVALLMSSRAT